MSGAAEGSHEPAPHSLAAKLTKLFEARKELTGKRPSYETVARAINTAAGESVISPPYVWELATGRTDNPKLRHLEVLAAYFEVPVRYFIDDETEDALTPQLELLQALADEGVRGLAVDVAGARLSPESLKTVRDMVLFLKEQDSKLPSAPHGKTQPAKKKPSEG